MVWRTFPDGGVFPPARLSTHINQTEMKALYHLLGQFSTRHSDVLRLTQVIIDVDYQSVVAFNCGRAINRETYVLQVQLFTLQM